MVKPGGTQGPEVHNWLRITMEEGFREWEMSRLAIYPGDETLNSLVERLQRFHNEGKYVDKWTGLQQIEFALVYLDDESRNAAKNLDIAPKQYVAPNYLRVLQDIEKDYPNKITLTVSRNRRDVTLTVSP